jgi:isovaleryl-CoA dehydrogenase
MTEDATGAGYREALEEVITEVVAPDAARVDAEGVFPTAGVAALGEAGLLGLTTATEVGGGGAGPGAAATVIEALAAVCGSTAMVTLMHYAATAVIEAHGPESVRRQVAAGSHLSTLAFSETGSRSHFWVSGSTATAAGEGVRLDGQ